MSNVLTNHVEPLDSDLMNPVIALRIGATFSGLAVVIAIWWQVYGHGAESSVLNPQEFELFSLGLQLHLFHALAMVAISFAGGMMWQRHYVRWAVLSWSLGIVAFSGSVYAYVLTDLRAFSAIAPFGALAFLVGWILVAIGGKFYTRLSPDTSPTGPISQELPRTV
jgi:uncharacterized membrane protein YgdD (TMEM256/DUF423 family)